MAIANGGRPDFCERLRSLHVRGQPLLLPNAWDAASARTVVAAEFPAVATTSSGVAAALEYWQPSRLVWTPTDFGGRMQRITELRQLIGT
jgi:2-methylisocitrate lyase-like PEP mutase family enzyme